MKKLLIFLPLFLLLMSCEKDVNQEPQNDYQLKIVFNDTNSISVVNDI